MTERFVMSLDGVWKVFPDGSQEKIRGSTACAHPSVLAGSSSGVRCGSCKKSLVFSAEKQMYVEQEDFMAPMDKNVFEGNYSAAEMDKVVKEREEFRRQRNELDGRRTFLEKRLEESRRTAMERGDEVGSLKSDYSLLLAENAKLRREIDRLNRRLTEATRKKGPYER